MNRLPVADDRVGPRDPGPAGRRRRLVNPRCPRCGERGLWRSWFTMRDACPNCLLSVGGSGHAAASLWISTWVVTVAVVSWVVAGFVIAGTSGAWWISPGAIGVALVIPPVTYRLISACTLRLLWRLDPPAASRGGRLR